jgi:hypothetical protein
VTAGSVTFTPSSPLPFRGGASTSSTSNRMSAPPLACFWVSNILSKSPACRTSNSCARH